MKAERPDAAHDAKNRAKQKPKHGAKPKQAQQRGPIGFGSVMGDVKKGPNGKTAAETGKPVDAGLLASLSMGAVQTTQQLANDASFGIRSATEAVTEQGRSPAHLANQEPAVPTALGRMTPSAALDVVVDEATKLEISEAAKEFHVELEPVHLGPLVVRLRREPDGRLDVRFRARQADAARVLDAGSELLRDRLAAAGFHAATVAVEQDAQLVLTLQG